jgi:hexosaminidase
MLLFFQALALAATGFLGGFGGGSGPGYLHTEAIQTDGGGALPNDGGGTMPGQGGGTNPGDGGGD